MILLLSALALATSEKDRVLINQLDREVVALKQRTTYLQEQLQHCGTSDAPPIYAELTQVFAGSSVQVERKGQLVRVVLPADILFAADSTRLRAEAQGSLDLLATALKLHTVTVIVTVYTDNQPLSTSLRKVYATAWEWTAARSVVITRELVERYGVPSEHIRAAAGADSQPLESNDTPESRSVNRRVVVEILEEREAEAGP